MSTRICRLLPIAVASCVTLSLGTHEAKASTIISVDLGSGEAVESTDIAGVVPAAGWTQASGSPGFSSQNLFFSDGTDSGADISTGATAGSGNTGTLGASTATPDFEMFNRGIRIPSQNPQPRNGFLTITNLPTTGDFALGYDIYLYVGSTGPNLNPGAFSATIGTQTFFADFPQSPTFTGTFEQITSTSSSSPSTSGNYFLFSGLTGPSQSIDIAAAGNNRNAITGLQIVAVPEPASLGLIAAGVALLMPRARRG